MAAAVETLLSREREFSVLFDSAERIGKPEGLGPQDVAVELSHDYDMRPADAGIESEKDAIWESRKAKSPRLYNASKFRLKGIKSKEKCLTLYIGLTDYKSYICTNMHPERWQLLRQTGMDQYGDGRACFADALAVGAVVVSRDSQLVFIRRSHVVYEAPGKVDTPGGHPEPSELSTDDGHLSQDPDLARMNPASVVFELFRSMIREVRDEVNLPEHCMSQPQLLGICQNHHTGDRPGLCFLINCNLSGEEIHTNYQKGGPEAFESTELLLMPTSELQSPVLSNRTKTLLSDMTPCCKASLYFYVRHMQGITQWDVVS